MKFLVNQKIIALLILATAVLASYSIIAPKPKTKNNKPLIAAIAGDQNNNPALAFKNQPPKQTNENFNQGIPAEEKPTDNLTDLLAQGYAREIFRNNPGDLNEVARSGLKPPSDDSLQKIIAERIGQDINFERFEMKDIKISRDGSVERQLSYLLALGKITEKNWSKFNQSVTEILDAWIEKRDYRPMEKYLTIVPNQINDLLALEVPPQWKELHLQNLNLWQKKSAIFTAITKFEEDPIKTYQAFGQLPAIFNENVILQNILEKQFRELNAKKTNG